MPTTETPRDFERRVAALYRMLGAEVAHDYSLAGSQIDVFVQERTPSGGLIRTAVECKSYTGPVGIDVVRSLAGLAALLKQRNLVDRVALVCPAGFTKSARQAAQELGVDLIEVADLEARAKPTEAKLKSVMADFSAAHLIDASGPAKPKRAFVVMPFAAEFDDVYVLGIREVIEKLGMVVDRADDIEHNANILTVVQESIRNADVVIGETTSKNPNCFYEIGYAHALGKPTILIGRAGQEIPFDLRALNLVVYSSIVELRDSLSRRVKATLSAA